MTQERLNELTSLIRLQRPTVERIAAKLKRDESTSQRERIYLRNHNRLIDEKWAIQAALPSRNE